MFNAEQITDLQRWLEIDQRRLDWFRAQLKRLEGADLAVGVQADSPGEFRTQVETNGRGADDAPLAVRQRGGRQDEATRAAEDSAETERAAAEASGDSVETSSPASQSELLLRLRRLAAGQVAVLERKLELQAAILRQATLPSVELPTVPAAAMSTAQERQAEPERTAASEDAGSEQSGPTAGGGLPWPGLPGAAGSEEANAEDQGRGGDMDQPETAFDPALLEARGELESAAERLKTLTRQAEGETAMLKLLEMDLENTRGWIELVVQIDDDQRFDPEFKAELPEQRERTEMIQRQAQAFESAKGRTVNAIQELEDELQWLRLRVSFLQSPLSPYRMQRWLVSRGPTVIAILLVTVLAWLVSRSLVGRLMRSVARHRRSGTREEREERAETLRRMVQGLVNLTLVVLAAIAFLDQVGVDVTVLLGGAAVFGMALAFGAQNLIKDYFGGLLILMENQYRVGNVIRVGQLAGLVEDVSLRMTVLRDLEGVAHFIPHGQITTVSNLSHGWSRTVLDIGVAYREQVDRVIEVLRQIADELHADSRFGELLPDRAEILGVDALADSAVVIKLMMKTKPLKQWEVKREMLRRIKNRFDELGIEIPFPHRTIYHRSEDDDLAIEFAGQGRDRR